MCVGPRARWGGWVEGPGGLTAVAPLSRMCCGFFLVSFLALARGEVGGWGSRRASMFFDYEHSDDGAPRKTTTNNLVVISKFYRVLL